jgi:predicted  nucleic acid-binding Zn-ribbon protein
MSVSVDNGSEDVDLDRTDRLPILAGTTIAEDVPDDAVPLDYGVTSPSIQSELERARGDTDSRAQAAALARAQGVARAQALAQAQAQAQAHTLANELAELRAALDAERTRARATVAARDATIVQVLRSLAERDAQLSALQREHAQIVPALEERSKTGTQLDAELHAVRARSEALVAELETAQEAVAALRAELRQGQTELGAARDELGATRLELEQLRTQASSQMEALRTREWRQEFDQNLYRELEAQLEATRQQSAAIEAERDQLEQRVATLDAAVAARDALIAELQGAAAAVEDVRTKRERDLEDLDGSRAKLTAEITALQGELAALRSELAQLRSEALRMKELLVASEKTRAELFVQVRDLQAEAQTKEEEMNVLLAHLQEARRAVRPADTEAKRMSVVHAVPPSVSPVTSRAPVSAVPPAPLAAAAPPAPPLAAVAAFAAELLRIDGQENTAFPLARRTRIGRAPGCELQIESSSVSRHHALVLLGQRDVIIEDLNSTNGVLVNGRKISRQLLNDGDALTIGDAQFRVRISVPRASDSPPPKSI